MQAASDTLPPPYSAKRRFFHLALSPPSRHAAGIPHGPEGRRATYPPNTADNEINQLLTMSAQPETLLADCAPIWWDRVSQAFRAWNIPGMPRPKSRRIRSFLRE
jgi:hypothetical protein